MRLKGKGSPDAIDRRRRIPRRLRHRARAPLGRVTRLLLKRLAHHLGHGVVIDAPGTAGARLVVKPVKTMLCEAIAPLPGGLAGHAQHAPNLHIGKPFGRQQHDVRPIGQASPDFAPARQPLKLVALVRAQLDLHRKSHHHAPRIDTTPLNNTNFAYRTLGRVDEFMKC